MAGQEGGVPTPNPPSKLTTKNKIKTKLVNNKK